MPTSSSSAQATSSSSSSSTSSETTASTSSSSAQVTSSSSSSSGRVASSSSSSSGHATSSSSSSGASSSSSSSSSSGYPVDAGNAEDAGTGTASFRCVNWADPGDNYQTGDIQPTGLSSATDTYATALAKSNAILSGFQTVLQANSIRVGINEPGVSGAWWTTGYKAIVDAATSLNMKVILGYWAHHNGEPDSVSAFNTMWQTVITTYIDNPLVYFDIANEPYAYTESAWATLVVNWLALFPTVPRNRVLVAGVVTGNGWDADVTQVGADSRLDGTLLNLHVYPSNSTSLTAAGWEQVIKQKVGAYASRTVATEWGAPLSGGVVYAATGTPTSVNGAFMMGVPDQFRTFGMGGCLWAGLEGTNGMSVAALNGTGTNLTLTVTNASGLARLQYAWGL